MIAAYVWDYAGRMDLLRIFWDAAREIDPQAYKFDEGLRFPVCNEGKLKESFQQAGLTGIQTANLDIITVFKNFDDYWNPFLGGQGPPPVIWLSLIKVCRKNWKIMFAKNYRLLKMVL